ncbi:MAG: HEAT repeat domain-containing protein [Candidatus Micrarchaeia archaeon]
MKKPKQKPVVGKKERRAKELLLELRASESEARAAAAAELGELGLPSIVPHLIPLLEDNAWSVRLAALNALGKLNTRDARAAILRCLGDRYTRVRAEAVRWCGRLRMAESVEPLCRILLEEKLPFIRCAVATALGEIGSPRAIGPLVRVLKGSEHASRICAAQALGKIGGPAVVRALEDALKDRSAEIRREAATILRALGATYTPRPPAHGKKRRPK